MRFDKKKLFSALSLVVEEWVDQVAEGAEVLMY